MMWITHLDGGPKRVNHAAVSVGHKIYSFGGYCTGEDSKAYNSMDVHVLNTSTFRWTKHPVSDLPYFENDDILPYKRYGHTALAYGDKIYIWGGRNDRASDNILFCFDTTWHCWTAPKTSGSIPFARDGHTACLWKNFMIIFGGFEEETDSWGQFVYVLDLDRMEWGQIMPSGNEPSLRDFHTSVCWNNRMYMFGGRGAYYTGDEFYSNEMWYLDLNSFKWVNCLGTGDIPMGRRSHSSFVYNDKIYIFGGYNSLEKQHYNDMYEYDPLTNKWKMLNTPGNKPCERRRFGSVLLKDRLFVFGGTSPQQFSYGVEGEDEHLVDHCDMYILDLKPTLRTLCMVAVGKYKLDDSSLPNNLRIDLMNLFTPNKISSSRPNNSAG